MSDLKALLFEDPVPLCVLLGLVEIAALVALFRRRSRRTMCIAAVPLVLIAAVAITATMVTTETERLAATLDTLIAGVRNGDMAAVGELIDDTYADGRYTKAELLIKIEQTRRPVGLTDLKIRGIELNVGDTGAIVAFRAIVHVTHSAAAIRDTWPTRWRLWWIRRPDGWRLTSSRL